MGNISLIIWLLYVFYRAKKSPINHRGVTNVKEVFRNRNFRKLFFSNLFSGSGQGMTMIGISWYLVESTGSASLLGSTMLISSILTLLMGPNLGTWIDRFSRKTILQMEQLGDVRFYPSWLFGVFGECITNGCWLLFFFATTCMSQIHEPTLTAFVQETFDQKHYKTINSLLEVQNQIALVLAGAFAGMLLDKYGLHLVIL
nr:MFS transporter [Brevibacillus invocatus]